MEFAKRIQKLYAHSVMYRISDSIEVNMASMLRVKLHYLQRDIIRDAIRFKYEKPTSEFDTEGSLTAYGSYLSR